MKEICIIFGVYTLYLTYKVYNLEKDIENIKEILNTNNEEINNIIKVNSQIICEHYGSNGPLVF
jgi:hypothetical protein